MSWLGRLHRDWLGVRDPVVGHGSWRKADNRPCIIQGNGRSRNDGARWRKHKIPLVDNRRPAAEIDTGRIHAAIVATAKSAGPSGEAAHGAPCRARSTSYPLLIRAHSSWYKGKGPVGGGEDVSRWAVGEGNANRLISSQRRTVVGQLCILFDCHARE